MDNGKGRLALLSKDEAKPFIESEKKGIKVNNFFSLGEIVDLKGSKFRVTGINPKGLKLKVLPRNLQAKEEIVPFNQDY